MYIRLPNLFDRPLSLRGPESKDTIMILKVVRIVIDSYGEM